MRHISEWGDKEAWDNSVTPLAEMLHDATFLSPEQATYLARRILDLATTEEGEN